MTQTMNSVPQFVTCFGDLTVHSQGAPERSLCGLPASRQLHPEDDRVRWFGWCVDCVNALHAEALKINPRGVITEIAAGPDGIRTRIVEPGQYLTPHCALKCGLTGTEDCPDDYKGSENCPTC